MRREKLSIFRKIARARALQEALERDPLNTISKTLEW